MLVDFTEGAREVYVRAYERQLEGNLPLGYMDKPISVLTLHLISSAVQPLSPSAVDQEHLLAQPLSQEQAAVLPRHLQFRDYPPEVWQHYHTLATKLAATSMTNTLQLRPVMDSGGVTGEYLASFPSGQTRVVQSFTDKPVKQFLAAAKYFTEEALEYVNSTAFEANSQGGAVPFGGSDPERTWGHVFSIAMTLDLPLNGYEPLPFLLDYRRRMEQQYRRAQERLDDMEVGMLNHTHFAEDQRDRVERLVQAVIRVDAVLADKGWSPTDD